MLESWTNFVLLQQSSGGLRLARKVKLFGISTPDVLAESEEQLARIRTKFESSQRVFPQLMDQ